MKPFLLMIAAWLTTIACAQTPVTVDKPGAWSRVQSLHPGAAIHAEIAGGGPLKGWFRSAADDALVIRTAKGEQTVPRGSVISLTVKGRNRRLRHMLIGLGIGAGAGLAAGAIADHASACHSGQFCLNFHDIGKIILTPAGAIVGLGVGAALPARGWMEIYKGVK